MKQGSRAALGHGSLAGATAATAGLAPTGMLGGDP